MAGSQTGETGAVEQQQVTEIQGVDGQQVQQLATVAGVPDVPLEGITVIPASSQGGWSGSYHCDASYHWRVLNKTKMLQTYSPVHLPIDWLFG